MYRVPEGIAVPLTSGATDIPGAIRFVQDASGQCGHQIRLFKPSGAALAQGEVVRIAHAGAASGNPGVATVASGSAQIERVVVATEAIASGTWGWYWIDGYCLALVEGTTDVAAGDYLKIVTATSDGAFIKDGSARTANSCAIAQAAQAANSEVLARVFLFGDQVILT